MLRFMCLVAALFALNAAPASAFVSSGGVGRIGFAPGAGCSCAQANFAPIGYGYQQQQQFAPIQFAPVYRQRQFAPVYNQAQFAPVYGGPVFIPGRPRGPRIQFNFGFGR